MLSGPGRLIRPRDPLKRQMKMLAGAVLVGLIGGSAAAGFEGLLHMFHLAFEHVGFAGEHPSLPRWILWPLLPAVGCALATLFVATIARQLDPTRSKAAGPLHGVDQVCRAFHYGGGELRPERPTASIFGTSVVIASGASAGPEGPTAALGGAIGSMLAKLLHLSRAQRRLLLVAGCAAGVGAIFRCPLGGALFAASILYREPDFEAGAIVPSFVASVLGYSVFMLAWGYREPLLIVGDATAVSYVNPLELPWYFVLGVLCAIGGIALSVSLTRAEQLAARVRRLGTPTWVVAGIGGLLAGTLALAAPGIRGGDIHYLQELISNPPAATLTATLVVLMAAVLKCLATGATLGGGAPGGILGPAVFVGGTVGGLLAVGGNWILPGSVDDQLRASLVAVGMAGVLSAVMRSPIATAVMLLEITGSYGLIAPLMLVCAISYVLGRPWGVNQEQVATAALSPAHAADAVVRRLESKRVGDVLVSPWPHRVRPDTTLGEMLRRTATGAVPVYVVMDGDRLAGVIEPDELERLREADELSDLFVAEEMMKPPLIIGPDHSLLDAVESMDGGDRQAVAVEDRRLGMRWSRFAPSTEPSWGIVTRERIIEVVRSAAMERRQSAALEHTFMSMLEQDVDLRLVLSGRNAHLEPEKQPVPASAVGQSLRQLHYRDTYGVDVVALETTNELGKRQTLLPPDADRPLRADDRLLVIPLKRGKDGAAGEG